MALIDPEGLFFGERLRKCSDKSRLLWPYLFVAANTAGRLRICYDDLVTKVFVGFRNPPTEAEIVESITEYRRNFLAYPYPFDGTLWIQFYRKSGFLPHYEKAKDQRTAPPPKAYWEWIASYKNDKSLVSTLFRNYEISANSENLPIGIGVGIGVGVGTNLHLLVESQPDSTCREDSAPPCTTKPLSPVNEATGTVRPSNPLEHETGGTESFELQPLAVSTESRKALQEEAVAAKAIYKHYIETFGKNPNFYELTPERQTMLRGRVRDLMRKGRKENPALSREELLEESTRIACLCIDLLSHDPFHNGENDKATKYQDLKHVFRNTAKLEFWMDKILQQSKTKAAWV